MTKKLKTIELFAGVGGFRIALEGYQGKSASSGFKKKKKALYEVIWSNQWEPSTKRQHASEVYEHRFGKSNHSNEDIAKVIEHDFESIPDHDVLVGGFPCQDYSVATSLKNSGGLKGKKGVLWWSIFDILHKKGKNKPRYLILENVDRLLKSPANQRGRDFAVMLSCLSALGYVTEWRVINGADYGYPQRRRRVYMVSYLSETELGKLAHKDSKKVLFQEGVIERAYPTVESELELTSLELPCELGKYEHIEDVSNQFGKGLKTSPFKNSGVCVNGRILTYKSIANYSGICKTLGDCLVDLSEVPNEYLVELEDIAKWEYHKGAKKIKRVDPKTGFEYNFSEGSMIFPDEIDRASRTIITGEGGKTPSRFKHVINQSGTYRRLVPQELERLNLFPDNFTELENISDSKRAFFMGNALIVGIIENIGNSLYQSNEL